MIDDKKVDAFNRKLDLLATILGYQLVADMTVSQGAPILKRIGFNAKEIATIFDTTTMSVNARLAESRKRKIKKR
ncbi:MAG: hypothetical protein MUO85_01135 [candidate division Zixibacteria bacterium]|nr:hypothetical protein [candidate division Zixibacteria bacterium]